MNASVRERPILFSAPMVRAILAGTKTQTRRVVREPGWATADTLHLFNGAPWASDPHKGDREVLCPYGVPGDRLWVRETFAPGYSFHDSAEYGGDSDRVELFYRADNSAATVCAPQGTASRWRERYGEEDGPNENGSTIPSIYMPRWASRITLEITDVRVQRLQEISADDACTEGGPPSHKSIDCVSRSLGYEDFPRSWFAQLWDSINAKRAPWSSNPWVWALTFKRVTP